MKVVQTTEGVRHWGSYSDKEPHTDEQAETICNEANRKAEQLGIDTRYEVVDR
jgi:hypothetical protein